MSEVRGRSEKTTSLPPPRRPRSQPPPVSDVPRMPESLAKLTRAREKATAAHRYDKAFPVMLESTLGIANGVGRNISAEGMFVETREPLPMGTQVRVVFGSPENGSEICAVAEVKFQCFLNYSGSDGEQEGMRGMGMRFVRFEEGASAGREHAH